MCSESKYKRHFTMPTPLQRIWAFFLLSFVCTISFGKGFFVQDVTDKVCHGTHNELSISGGTNFHYRSLQQRYTGCTIVEGNLEVNVLGSEDGQVYDLSFLSTIRMVTGYVLVVANEADVIPMTSLVFIRGDSTFYNRKKEYTLFIALNHSPNGIQLPKLKEVSGNVFIGLNEACFIETIDWTPILRGELTTQQTLTNLACEQCSSQCPLVSGRRRCWGPGKDLCQQDTGIECDWLCQNTTCMKEGILGCCHPECVDNCTESWINTKCLMCRHFRYKGACVEKCPRDTYRNGQECVPLDSEDGSYFLQDRL